MRTHRCRFACFTIAQWEKEAAWLRQQHQKGWQFTHLTAGVFYHFAACPPEDVVYHLEYQDQKDLEAEPLQSLRRRGWAYVDRFTQYFYFRKPAKDISPEEAALLQNPAAQLGMVRRVFWGRMFPLFPLVGGVFLPQFVLPAGGPHRGPPLCPGAGGLWGRLSPVRPAVSPAAPGGLAQPASPGQPPEGDSPRKTGVLYHIALPRATARGRVFPWRPAPSCIAVSKTLHFSRFSPVVFQQFLPSPTVRLPLES